MENEKAASILVSDFGVWRTIVGPWWLQDPVQNA